MRQFVEKDVKNLLKNSGLRPSKRLGQNFLVDKAIIRKIMSAANLNAQDIVLEVGPGTGILTRELAKKAKKVLAVEKDRKMTEILDKTTKQFKNVKIIQRDILKIEPRDYNLKTKEYKIVANLPYYITSKVLRRFLEGNNPPKEMILMVQKEVGQRICAKPPEMSLLAVSVQFYAKSEIISYVPKSSFWPVPKVDSAIIKIIPHKSAKISRNQRLFFRIAKAGFSQPRKQLSSNLSKDLKIDREIIKNWLLKNKIQSERRAETLTLEDWVKLTRTFVSK